MGCGGLLASIFIVPIILILVCGIMIFSIVGGAISNVQNGGIISYDEAVFQNYADQQYQAAFGDSSAPEDNILIVFLTNEESDGYYVIAWVGDNINYQINEQFGAEGSVFGNAMLSSVNAEYHAYSVDKNLATVMNKMSDRVQSLNLESSFDTEEDHSRLAKSRVINYSHLSITEKTVNDALEQFTADTGIPAVIVVDTMENVFGKTVPTSTIITLLVLVVIIVIAIVMLVKGFKKRREDEEYNKQR